jgi:hypothetical protein
MRIKTERVYKDVGKKKSFANGWAFVGKNSTIAVVGPNICIFSHTHTHTYTHTWLRHE